MWSKVVRSYTRTRDTVSTRGKLFTWSRNFIHTLHLDCGHTKVYQGRSDPPKYKVKCPICQEQTCGQA